MDTKRKSDCSGTNLGMGLDDGETTSSMRFLSIRPEEIVRLVGSVLRRSWGRDIALCPRGDSRRVCRRHFSISFPSTNKEDERTKRKRCGKL